MSSFTCFEYFANVLDKLPSDEDRMALSMAIIYYGTKGIEPDLDPYLDATFEGLRDSIDNSIIARTNNKGGRPRKTENTPKKTGVTESETGVSETKTPVSGNQEGFEKGETGVIETRNPNLSYPDLSCPNLTNSSSKNSPKKKSQRFVPPSVEEVSAYVTEKGYSVDAEAFVNWYEAKGWMIGKNRMKNWRSAVATWERRQSADKPKGGATSELFDKYAE